MWMKRIGLRVLLHWFWGMRHRPTRLDRFLGKDLNPSYQLSVSALRRFGGGWLFSSWPPGSGLPSGGALEADFRACLWKTVEHLACKSL